MVWQVRITKTAAKQIKKLDTTIQGRITKFFRQKIIGNNTPRHVGKALRGNKVELWRYRVGDYRLICRLQDKLVTVLVLAVGHRKDIYHNISKIQQ